MRRVNSNVQIDQMNINKDEQSNIQIGNNYSDYNNNNDMYVKRDTPLANLFGSNSDNNIE